MTRIYAYLALPLFLSASVVLADDGQSPSFPCLNPPSLATVEKTRAVPGDALLADQPSFNCFAWQEFLAVTFPTDVHATIADYGTPGGDGQILLETYSNLDQLFAPVINPGDDVLTTAMMANPGARLLGRVSKLNGNFDPSSDLAEAFPPRGNWLADKDGNLVWYEILVNPAEYNYFYAPENEYFSAQKQYQAVQDGQHVALPMGVLGGQEGAMEFKAAWLQIPDGQEADFEGRYFLADASFCTNADETIGCEKGIVALVGLHIIHKTTSQPSWVWATFDHIDNQPSQAEVDRGAAKGKKYRFYRESCTPLSVPTACDPEKNASGTPVTQTSCAPNVSPSYVLRDFTANAGPETCGPYPIQVTRKFSLPDTNENPIGTTNKAAHAMIKRANPNSVWQYYQLINVLWSDSPVNENAGAMIPSAPLSETGFRPNLNAFKVSNPMLETYAQDVSCVACHSGATIATPKGERSDAASDYSFIFRMAQ